MKVFDQIHIRRRPGGPKFHGVMVAGARTMRCALGRSGQTVFKVEGDGATPSFVAMRPLWGYFRGDRVRRPQTVIPMERIRADDGWCDAPQHPAYNRPVTLPFAASHEKMMREDGLYDICIVLDFNMAPNARKRGGGSAIFLHCAKSGYAPTEGCIALARSDLEWLLQHIDTRTCIVVNG